MLDAAGDGQRDEGHRDVQPDRGKRGGRHVVHAKQIETREEASRDRAGQVAAIEETEPRHAVGRRLDAARDDGERASHQQRRRQQADARHERAQNEAGHPRARPRRINAAQNRHRVEDDEAERADAELEKCVDAQRMLPRRHISRQQQAAETHAAHVDPEQHAEGDGG